MKALDFILPAKNAGPASETETAAFPHSNAKANEPFDKMMNRALSKPAREPGEKPAAVKKPASNPGAVRKPRPSVDADSNTSATAAPTSLSVRDSSPASSTKSEDDSSSHETASSTAPDKGKEAGSNAGTGSVDADNTAALQTLAASLAVDQTPTTTPGISKMAKTDAEINPLEFVGTKVCSDPVSPNDLSENAPALAKSDLMPGAKAPAEAGKKVSGAVADPAKMSGPDDGAIPVQALFDQAEAVNETPANTANSEPGKPHALTAEAAGTSAAQHTATMKNADQAAKVAGVPEQSLPGVTLVAATVQEAFRPRPAAKAAARVESSDAAAPASAAVIDRPPTTGETSSSNLISASSQTELRTRALDRTHDMLALHGMQLKQTNTDSLHVVIKPGAGLQLSLQMKQTSDGIEAQAVLQQGNFNDLNKHWAELQQRLEERGIRLAPLGNDSATANSGNENFQRQYRQPGQPDALSAGAFAEFAVAGAAAARTTPAAEAITARGWESWA